MNDKIIKPQTHSTHLADIFFYDRPQGLEKILSTLEIVVKNGLENAPVNVKIDGSPSIVFGWFEEKFFVATKSIFSKNPKGPRAYFSEQEIENNSILSEDLKLRLKLGLKYLEKITPKNNYIYQGDFLFIKEDLKELTIKGREYLTFHLNVIKYAVGKDDLLSKKILNVKMGLAVHTVLEMENSSDLSTIKHVAFGVKKEIFNRSNDVFLTDTYPKCSKGKMLFFGLDEVIYESAKRTLKSIEINYSLFEEPKIKEYFIPFINHCIRQDIQIENSVVILENFKDFIKQKDKTKHKDSAINLIDDKFYSFLNIFYVYQKLQDLTDLFVSKFEAFGRFNCFIQDMKGNIERTGQEGFIITSGELEGVKLINRKNFSKHNFSTEIIRGYQLPKC